MLTPICSVNGRIDQLLLFYRCPTCDDPSQVGFVFKSLLDTLGPHVQVYILVQLTNGTTIDHLESGIPNVHLIPVNHSLTAFEHPLTQWAQDVVLAFRDDAGRLVLRTDDSRLDYRVFDLVKHYIDGLEVHAHKHPDWQGGNILPIQGSSPVVLVGGDILRSQLTGLPRAQKKLAQQQLERQLSTTFGNWPVLWVNRLPEHGVFRGKQPIFHLDLYLLPLGLIPKIDPHRQLIFVAELKKEYVFGAFTKERQELALALDQTAAWFANDRMHQGHRFLVKRLPLLAFEEEWRMASYANALVENTQTVRKIWLPDYRPKPLNGNGIDPLLWKAIDDIQSKLQQEFQALGIDEIAWVDLNFYELTRQYGALHCLIKVLGRSILNT